MSEIAYQNLTKLAAELCDMPFAVIALINSHRQYVRAVVGIADRYHDCLLSICTYTAKYRSTLIVENTTAHIWLNNHIMVMSEPAIRFLASVPLHSSSENSAGVLCVFDQYERKLTTQQINHLSTLATQAGLIHQLSRQQYQPHHLRVDYESIKKQERQRIARDLHDDLGQHLLMLKMDLMMMKKLNYDSLDEQINAAIHRIEKSIMSTRKIIKNLRSSEMQSGLFFAIKNHIQELEKSTHLQYKLEYDNFFSEEKMSENARLILFRTLQEALTNIIRHAKASTVCIRIWGDMAAINMNIIDDGIGINIKPDTFAKQSTFGLTGMRERIHTANGKLIINSSHGCGTELLVSIPFSEFLSTELENHVVLN